LPEGKQPRTLADIRLSVEDRDRVVQLTSELIAVQVYRELQKLNDYVEAAGCAIIGNCSNGSCNIIGNCSSSKVE
jgi:hypothetical protein